MTQNELKKAYELADTYLIDGAPHSAARVLQTAVDKLRKFAKHRDDELEKILSK